MTNIANLLTEHMAIWTAADTEKKSGRGRASGNAGSVYGVKKLRELILELAVRGKLVPQDLNDEPASELLKRIQVEKAKLIAEGKLKKEKPLALIDENEKPFELPKGWEFARLSYVANLENGDRGKNYPNKDALVQEGVPFVNAGHLENGFVNKSEMTFITEERFNLLSGGKFIENDILFCLRGSLGKCAVVNGINKGAIASSLVIIRVNSNLDLNYFYNYLTSNLLMQSVRKYDNGTAQPNLSSTDLAKFVLPIPPITEQHRIVAKVDELMVLCDQLEQQHSNAQEAHETLVSQLLATLTQSQNAAEFNANWQRIYAHFDVLFTTEASIDALKQTLLQLAVMGKLVPQDPNDEPASELLKRIQAEKAKLIAEGKLKKEKPLAPITEDEKPFQLPNGWEWVQLREITLKITDGEHLSPTKTESGMPLVSAKDVKAEGLDLSDTNFVKFEDGLVFRERCNPEYRDVLICSRGTIGRCTLVETDEIFCLMGSVILLKNSSEYSPNYLTRYLQTTLAQVWMTGASSATAVSALYLKDVAKLGVPIPPLAEQHRIVAKVDAVMTLCDQLKTRIQQANQQQQTIADALVAQAVIA